MIRLSALGKVIKDSILTIFFGAIFVVWAAFELARQEIAE